MAVALNLLVATILTLILRALRITEGPDGTTRNDYFADENDPHPIPTQRTETPTPAEPIA